MSKEIKFRGKKSNSNHWAYGYMVVFNGIKYIMREEIHQIDNKVRLSREKVDPETVGQYIGQKTPNGTEMYEGDILGLTWNEVDEAGETEWESKHLIKWGGKDYPAFDLKPRLYCEENGLSHLSCSPEAPHYEVIGNIHQNPELL